HCGLHSPIRARSETIDHTLSTGASTSVDNSSTSLNVVSAMVLLGSGAGIDALTYCRYPNRMGNATYVTPWAQYSSPNENLPSAVPSRPKADSFVVAAAQILAAASTGDSSSSDSSSDSSESVPSACSRSRSTTLPDLSVTVAPSTIC